MPDKTFFQYIGQPLMVVLIIDTCGQKLGTLSQVRSSFIFYSDP